MSSEPEPVDVYEDRVDEPEDEPADDDENPFDEGEGAPLASI